MKSWSAIPIATMTDRIRAFNREYKNELKFWEMDLRDYRKVERVLQRFQPDTVVHFGECPSAPYSMIDVHHATFVQSNNIATTFNLLFAIKKLCPNTHLIKLGTMGEYGTPNIDIPEGFFEVEFRGRNDRLPFPRQAGSWYHWSKVHGSNNIMFACKLWHLKATDVMQGVVCGTNLDLIHNCEPLLTRLDFDQAFGTVIHRFCCQAVIGHPLTVYGKGHQKRSFMSLKDSMKCLSLIIENPPEDGQYRVFNQFEGIYDVTEVAYMVQEAASELDLKVDIINMENPRKEQEEHYYNPDRKLLLDLGYEPTHDLKKELEGMLKLLLKYRNRIKMKNQVLIPDVRWTGEKRKTNALE